jgi:hypothetical protein
MSYLIVEAECKFWELQAILKRHGIELQQRATYWRAILHDDVPDPIGYVGNIIVEYVDCYVDLEQMF